MTDAGLLYGIVEEYAALGVHRTGTAVDWATAEWMADHLSRRGLDVTLDAYEFDQWQCQSTLTADNVAIEHLPLYYGFTGEVTTDQPRVESIDPASGGFASIVDEPIARSVAADADASVFATDHPNGSLVAINRTGTLGTHPTVLIAARELARVQAADSLRLEARAELTRGRTASVLATNGRPGPPLVVSTPLTGWYQCAGERATGIAVLLDLIGRLTQVPVLVVATTGHEIGQLGVERWVDGAHDAACLGIVHLGASLAVEEGDPGSRRLAATRLAMTNQAATDADAMAQALLAANLHLVTEAENWIGEAASFAPLNVPLVSFSGAGIDFHTPDDVPERATSPAAMKIAADAVGAAVASFVATLEGSS